MESARSYSIYVAGKEKKEKERKKERQYEKWKTRKRRREREREREKCEEERKKEFSRGLFHSSYIFFCCTKKEDLYSLLAGAAKRSPDQLFYLKRSKKRQNFPNL